ncbi:hypothetical protein EV426DRAFT_229667 [Tirmania nivea]|nr:hypothetical protein EV426DRAFT_229667 [Tirmania nivea]
MSFSSHKINKLYPQMISKTPNPNFLSRLCVTLCCQVFISPATFHASIPNSTTPKSPTPPMALPSSDIAVPGQPLGATTEFLPGAGIHIRHDGQLSANIVGRIHINPTTTPPTLSLLSSPQDNTGPAATINPATLLPHVGSTVLCRVTRTNPRQANVSIFALDVAPVNDTAVVDGVVAAATSAPIPTGDTFPGVIRVQDVRATEKDKVRIASSFKPGDIVRATVISLGDQSNYYLSTGRNELGVVVARSDSGDLLYPKSWKEMICSRTGIVEERKVAKPI